MLDYSDAVEKLRIWKPALSDDEVDASKRALAHGIERMMIDSHRPPRPRELIWWLMQEAADTWRRMPDKERAWNMYKVMWPEIARPSEDNRQVEIEQNNCKAQALNAREKDKQLADTADEYAKRYSAGGIEAITLRNSDPTAIERAEVVYRWLCFVNTANTKDPRRDKRAFLILAAGGRSRKAAREFGGDVSDYAVRRVKDKVLKLIETGLNRCVDAC